MQRILWKSSIQLINILTRKITKNKLIRGKMPLNHYVYIFRCKDIDPLKNRAEIKTDTMLFIAIGVKYSHDAARVAKEEVEKEAQLIELCVAFGASGTQKVIDGIDNVVPVGNVQYSLTDVHKLLALLHYLKGIRH